jgi:hypothetical protein
MMYMLKVSNQQKALFTGDCLFYGGVGMFFEGSPV